MLKYNMVTPRQEQLLSLVIDYYFKTAEPVGSKFLVDTETVVVSGATVRNELRALEEHGLLTHPHTSAGRLPTEAGYRYYIEHLLKPETPAAGVQRELRQLRTTLRDRMDRMKSMGRFISDYVENAVIISFSYRSIYYTGMVNLFSQPEFSDSAHTIQISAIFDECEQRFAELGDRLKDDGQVEVLVGKDNPLGRACSAVVARMGDEDIVAIVGPARMPYRRAVGVLEFMRQII